MGRRHIASTRGHLPFFGLLTVLLLGAAHGADHYPPAEPDAQVDTLMAWWPGTFRNDSQIQREGRPGGGDGRRWVEVRVRQLSGVPDKLLFATYTSRDPEFPFRRVRIYRLGIDPESGQARAELLIPKRGTEPDSSPDADDFRALPGCAIYFRREGVHLRGAMRFGACRYEPTPAMGLEGVDEVISHTEMLVGPDEFWYSDALYDAATLEPLITRSRDAMHELLRVEK